MITYKEQFDKLTRAYISGEVDPWDCKACFVGNMLDNDDTWAIVRDTPNFYTCKGDVRSRTSVMKNRGSYREFSPARIGYEFLDNKYEGFYTAQDIVDIEGKFLQSISAHGGKPTAWFAGLPAGEKDEEALFKAFEETLEFLKELHISKGEVIDETPVFTKRALRHEQV